MNTVPNEKLKTQRVVACPLLVRYLLAATEEPRHAHGE